MRPETEYRKIAAEIRAPIIASGPVMAAPVSVMVENENLKGTCR